MTWGKVDDKLHSHIKAARAGVEAMGLWVLALSWCAAYMTDGEIPAEVPARLAGRRGAALASKLVASKLWDKSEFGYRFRNWSEYQPTRANVEAQRADAKTRMQQRRGLTTDVRANKPRTNGEQPSNEQRTSQDVRAPFACPDPTRPVPEERTLPRPLSQPVGEALPEGVSGSTGTAEQAERERRADVESVAERGRLIDPSLEHDAPRPNASTPRPPSVRLVVDLLNDGSEGAFAVMVDSHSRVRLEQTIRELFDGPDEIDAEAYAVLALWARERLGNGLAWAKRAGVGVKWLITPGSLASAVGQSQGWWRRVARNHQGELATLLARFDLAPSAPAQPAAIPAPRAEEPKPAEQPQPVALSVIQARAKAMKERSRGLRPGASPADRTCAAGPEHGTTDRGAQEPEQQPDAPADEPASDAPAPLAPSAGEAPSQEPETNLRTCAGPENTGTERPSRPPVARVIPTHPESTPRARAAGGSDDR